MKSRSDWPAFCSLCLDDIIGNPRQQPLGRDDALVNVCNTCDSAHPRQGGYTFGEATRSAHINFGVQGHRRSRPQGKS